MRLSRFEVHVLDDLKLGEITSGLANVTQNQLDPKALLFKVVSYPSLDQFE